MTIGPDVPDYSRSRAVLVGVSRYEDPRYNDPGFDRLVSAGNSLRTMRDLLVNSDLCGWPEDRVEVLPDPGSISDLAVLLKEIARATADTLLLYYVGHGELTPSSELMLTVTSSKWDHPTETGLRFELVRDAFRASPARVKVAVLDCCGSGRASHRTLGGDLTRRAAVTGAYILTAARDNNDAHRPEAAHYPDAATSFTAALDAVVRRGVPGGAEWLTINELFPHLEAYLREQGLPEPGQAVSNTATDYLFTRNAAPRDTWNGFTTQQALADLLDETQRQLDDAKAALNEARQAAERDARTAADLRRELITLQQTTTKLTKELAGARRDLKAARHYTLQADRDREETIRVAQEIQLKLELTINQRNSQIADLRGHIKALQDQLSHQTSTTNPPEHDTVSSATSIRSLPAISSESAVSGKFDSSTSRKTPEPSKSATKASIADSDEQIDAVPTYAPSSRELIPTFMGILGVLGLAALILFGVITPMVPSSVRYFYYASGDQPLFDYCDDKYCFGKRVNWIQWDMRTERPAIRSVLSPDRQEEFEALEGSISQSGDCERARITWSMAVDGELVAEGKLVGNTRSGIDVPIKPGVDEIQIQATRTDSNTCVAALRLSGLALDYDGPLPWN